MRHFKFRFWDKKLKKFCYCGELVAHSSCLPKKLSDKNPVYGQVLTPCNHWKEEAYAEYPTTFFDDRPSNFVIQQFTGLYDIHGREIYEGDIIRNVGGEEEEVKYYQEQCCFVAFDMTISLWNINGYEYAVVGNIFEGVNENSN